MYFRVEARRTSVVIPVPTWLLRKKGFWRRTQGTVFYGAVPERSGIFFISEEDKSEDDLLYELKNSIFAVKRPRTMEIYRVAFIGHRVVDDFFFVEEQVDSVVRELLSTKEYVEFYVGRNGEFDTLVASVIKRVKQEIGEYNSSLILVLPYPVAEMESYEDYYDEVEYPRELYKVHYKSAITKRNQWLVENSDMLIAYVTRGYGGAAQCLKKAIAGGIEIRRVDRVSVE